MADENVGSVHDRLMELGAELTLDTVRHIAAGDLKPIPQDELLKGVEPTPAPKIFKEDCRIDWQQPARNIHNHVRGLSPYPAAWCEMKLYENQEEPATTVKVLETRITTNTDLGLRPGELALSGKKAYAGTQDGAIELVLVQPAGKRPMAAVDYLRGLRIGENGRSPFFF